MATSPERKSLQTQCSIYIVAAVIAGSVNAFLRASAGQGAPFTPVNYLLSTIAWIAWGIGCVIYARSKAYHWAFGLIGLVPCLGIIVLITLPNKWSNEQTPPPTATNYPRPPSGN